MTITNRNEITFIKADKQHLELVNECFNSPHIQEFWETDEDTWNNFTNNILNNKRELVIRNI
jgi:hypothetical protein